MELDNQVWESDRYVIKIERIKDHEIDSSSFLRAVIFTKSEDGLRFLEFVWKNDEYLQKLIEKMDMKQTNKKLILE